MQVFRVICFYLLKPYFRGMPIPLNKTMVKLKKRPPQTLLSEGFCGSGLVMQQMHTVVLLPVSGLWLGHQVDPIS